jgi:hypothetical protein
VHTTTPAHYFSTNMNGASGAAAGAIANFIDLNQFDKNQLHVFAKIQGTRERICITYGPTMRSLAFVTPVAITNYPRLTGDGDYKPGSQYGPQDPKKARFGLDLNQWEEGTAPHEGAFEAVDKYMRVIEAVDSALLDFMFGNQLKWLGRKNLSKEEVRMLQIPSIKSPIDKDSGAEKPHAVKLQSNKFYFDQVGNERERKINVCDHSGKIVPDGTAMPGDAVCCTSHLGSVYNGVGGDKFGISWQLEDVQIVCQAEHLKPRQYLPIFQSNDITGFETHDYTDVAMEC